MIAARKRKCLACYATTAILFAHCVMLSIKTTGATNSQSKHSTLSVANKEPNFSTNINISNQESLLLRVFGALPVEEQQLFFRQMTDLINLGHDKLTSGAGSDSYGSKDNSSLYVAPVMFDDSPTTTGALNTSPEPPTSGQHSTPTAASMTNHSKLQVSSLVVASNNDRASKSPAQTTNTYNSLSRSDNTNCTCS